MMVPAALSVVVAILAMGRSDGCPASTISNSNRSTTETACTGENGTECKYQCSAGYIPVGRHVCQTYQVGSKHFINGSFFGGRCERLCQKSATCGADAAAVRTPSADEHGACFKTTCSPP